MFLRTKSFTAKATANFRKRFARSQKNVPRKTKVSRRNNQKLYKFNANVNRLFEENQKRRAFYRIFFILFFLVFGRFFFYLQLRDELFALFVYYGKIRSFNIVFFKLIVKPFCNRHSSYGFCDKLFLAFL